MYIFHAFAECYKNLRDLIIMVDSSSRITNNEFDSVKSFLKDIVSYFTVSSIDTRISIVQYSSSQEVWVTSTFSLSCIFLVHKALSC